MACMCGDTACPICFPGSYWAEEAETKMLEKAAELKLSQDEYQFLINMMEPLVTNLRASNKKMLDERLATESEAKMYDGLGNYPN